MLSDCLNISAKQFCNLQPIKPHRLILNSNVKSKGFIRLIKYYLICLIQFHNAKVRNLTESTILILDISHEFHIFAL